MTEHRNRERISDEDLARELLRVPTNHYVYWTGGIYRAQQGSARSEALKTITEVKVPVTVRELLKRAARIEGNVGFDPSTVRSGLRLHQGAKPAVYLLLEKSPEGDFRAVTNIDQPDGFEPKRTGEVVVQGDTLEEERRRRREMWQALVNAGGPNSVEPQVLRNLRIYGGAQGVWFDKANTSYLTPGGDGVAVALLHTGRSYADDFSEGTLLYRYPHTLRSESRDAVEIEAIKNAARCEVPVFIITHSAGNAILRDVSMGWVEDWDDSSGLALVGFENAPSKRVEPQDIDDEEFSLTDHREMKTGKSKIRPGQQRFKLNVFKRYGTACVVCGISTPQVLDAAHLRGKEANGCDDPRNGIVLCATHHRAFDNGLFVISPDTFKVTPNSERATLEDLRITRQSINHLRRKPHPEALQWRWNKATQRR